METYMENRLMDTAGVEEGESGKYGENTMKAYITICKIGSQQEFAVWLRKLKQGPWDSLEGCCGEGDGKEAEEGGDVYIPMADSCWGLAESNTIL